MFNKKLILGPIKLAAASSFLGITGSAIGNTAITSAGETMAGFSKPITNISMSGVLIKQIKNIKK